MPRIRLISVYLSFFIGLTHLLAIAGNDYRYLTNNTPDDSKIEKMVTINSDLLSQ
ncbi:Uncharacterized protein YR821_1216 [Yersinia ruckeri]|nr:hypothetical protein yruck0001_19330 [Yersinia ruckeri ATCC 29473]QTD76147.1 Uncharacterized protein YR821_1216 [Yersinia ruckeri]